MVVLYLFCVHQFHMPWAYHYSVRWRRVSCNVNIIIIIICIQMIIYIYPIPYFVYEWCIDWCCAYLRFFPPAASCKSLSHGAREKVIHYRSLFVYHYNPIIILFYFSWLYIIHTYIKHISYTLFVNHKGCNILQFVLWYEIT